MYNLPEIVQIDDIQAISIQNKISFDRTLIAIVMK